MDKRHKKKQTQNKSSNSELTKISFNQSIYQGIKPTSGINEIKASLKERVKELECLYNISEISYKKQSYSLHEVIEDILKVLPKGWQYPEFTCAKIVFDKKVFATPNCQQTEYNQSSTINLNGINRGKVEISYLHKTPELDEGPFLKEERTLIDSIAKKLALIINRHEEQEEKKILESKLIHADRLVTIGELTAGIAHELNEPLGSILGFAQLIKSKDKIPKSINNDLDKIIKSSIHARQVIRKLMTFSKYEESPSEKVNINAIINDGLYFLESRCKKENIEIIKTLEENLPFIEGNPVQMHQVVVNLSVNAIQAMPNGGKLIMQTYSNTKKVVLVIQDTGIGISKDYIPKIFNPFFSMKDSEINTGLGLSVVHGIVNASKGEIKVESNLGVGTRFEISFPKIIK